MSHKITSILITGVPGVGKTTIIKKLIKMFKEKQIMCAGFYTEEMRSKDGNRIGFDVVDVDGKRGILARESPTDNVKRPRVGKYSVYSNDFEDIAVPVLKIDTKTILIVDEIGKMELTSKKFKQRMEEVFGKTVILATVPIRQTIDTVEKMKTNKSSLVLEVTKKNRNEIVDEIFQKINQMVLL